MSDLTRLVRWLFIFWGVCVISGSGLAVGLADAGMKVQDAFNSGAVIAFLPALVAGGIAAICWFMSS